MVVEVECGVPPAGGEKEELPGFDDAVDDGLSDRGEDLSDPVPYGGVGVEGGRRSPLVVFLLFPLRRKEEEPAFLSVDRLREAGAVGMEVDAAAVRCEAEGDGGVVALRTPRRAIGRQEVVETGLRAKEVEALVRRCVPAHGLGVVREGRLAFVLREAIGRRQRHRAMAVGLEQSLARRRGGEGAVRCPALQYYRPLREPQPPQRLPGVEPLQGARPSARRRQRQRRRPRK
mmetsp:Transcript_12722/g.41644  ORF Transcript_12722/g.41644 Transcript_12722/m.41644 type:complete len:231 (-) Transcript_12722:17-709(-)